MRLIVSNVHFQSTSKTVIDTRSIARHSVSPSWNNKKCSVSGRKCSEPSDRNHILLLSRDNPASWWNIHIMHDYSYRNNPIIKERDIWSRPMLSLVLLARYDHSPQIVVLFSRKSQLSRKSQFKSCCKHFLESNSRENQVHIIILLLFCIFVIISREKCQQFIDNRFIIDFLWIMIDNLSISLPAAFDPQLKIFN
jgi:hypothetical protein